MDYLARLREATLMRLNLYECYVTMAPSQIQCKVFGAKAHGKTT